MMSYKFLFSASISLKYSNFVNIHNDLWSPDSELQKNKVRNPDSILTHFEGLVLLSQTMNWSKLGVILVVLLKDNPLDIPVSIINASFVSRFACERSGVFCTYTKIANFGAASRTQLASSSSLPTVASSVVVPASPSPPILFQMQFIRRRTGRPFACTCDVFHADRGV